MFSPNLAIKAVKASVTVDSPSNFSATNSSTVVAEVLAAISATFVANETNSSLAATKSVSQLTSTIAAVFLSAETKVLTIPSAATLPAFLAAAANPFSLKNSTAFSIFPSVSTKAFLQSIIPAPVISLNSLTDLAVIIIKFLLDIKCKPYFRLKGK